MKHGRLFLRGTFGWYIPGFVQPANGGPVRKGMIRRVSGHGFWDVCFTHYDVAVPRWRQRMLHRRSLPSVAK